MTHNKDMSNYNTTKASDLRAGMVLASGFTVTHNSWRGVRTPRNKVEVEGFYPGRDNSRVQWNRNTTLFVRPV